VRQVDGGEREMGYWKEYGAPELEAALASGAVALLSGRWVVALVSSRAAFCCHARHCPTRPSSHSARCSRPHGRARVRLSLLAPARPPRPARPQPAPRSACARDLPGRGSFSA
jgi:hypothetical protein